MRNVLGDFIPGIKIFMAPLLLALSPLAPNSHYRLLILALCSVVHCLLYCCPLMKYLLWNLTANSFNTRNNHRGHFFSQNTTKLKCKSVEMSNTNKQTVQLEKWVCSVSRLWVQIPWPADNPYLCWALGLPCCSMEAEPVLRWSSVCCFEQKVSAELKPKNPLNKLLLQRSTLQHADIYFYSRLTRSRVHAAPPCNILLGGTSQIIEKTQRCRQPINPTMLCSMCLFSAWIAMAEGGTNREYPQLTVTGQATPLSAAVPRVHSAPCLKSPLGVALWSFSYDSFPEYQIHPHLHYLFQGQIETLSLFIKMQFKFQSLKHLRKCRSVP